MISFQEDRTELGVNSFLSVMRGNSEINLASLFKGEETPVAEMLVV